MIPPSAPDEGGQYPGEFGHAPEGRLERDQRPGHGRGSSAESRPSGALLRTVAALGIVLLSATVCEAGQRVVFEWGRSMRIASHELDLEEQRLVLNLLDGGSVAVPLSIVRRVVGADADVLLDLNLDALTPDPHEPIGTVAWLPADGWSGSERCDEWEGTPQWEFRWTDQDSARALLPPAPASATRIEFRLLSISYAIRVLGGVADPSTQLVNVALNGRSLGTLELSHDGWNTYSLPLPARVSSGAVVLRLETDYRAQPSTFTQGRRQDRRHLGVALDFVRYRPGP